MSTLNMHSANILFETVNAVRKTEVSVSNQSPQFRCTTRCLGPTILSCGGGVKSGRIRIKNCTIELSEKTNLTPKADKEYV